LRKGREVDHELPAFCSEAAEARTRLFVADTDLVEKMKMKERKRRRQILVLEAMKVPWHALLCFDTFFIMQKWCSLLCFSTIFFYKSSMFTTSVC